MQLVLVACLSAGAFMVAESRTIGADAPKPAAVLFAVTEYGGLTGPRNQFSLQDDGIWSYSTSKPGDKAPQTTSGKLNADESKALLDFVKGLELEKHTQKRAVEDTAMLSVRFRTESFIDLKPDVAVKIRNKVKEIREPKGKPR
jgi:hypothetical protein